MTLYVKVIVKMNLLVFRFLVWAKQTDCTNPTSDERRYDMKSFGVNFMLS